MEAYHRTFTFPLMHTNKTHVYRIVDRMFECIYTYIHTYIWSNGIANKTSNRTKIRFAAIQSAGWRAKTCAHCLHSSNINRRRQHRFVATLIDARVVWKNWKIGMRGIEFLSRNMCFASIQSQSKHSLMVNASTVGNRMQHIKTASGAKQHGAISARERIVDKKNQSAVLLHV